MKFNQISADQLVDGRAYLLLSTRLPVECIAVIAGVTEDRVRRLIKLAQDEAAKK